MKLKFSTVFLVIAAIVFAGGLYFWDQQRPASSPAGEEAADSKPLFQFKEADISKLSVKTKALTLALEKTTQGWQIKSPQSGAADDGTVTFLLSQLATGTSSRTLPVKTVQLQEFGLVDPVATVDITLKDQKTHQLVLGGQTFDQSSVYARVDPASQSASPSVAIVPTGFLDAVNRPLKEWQAKPKSAAPRSPTAAPAQSPTRETPPAPTSIPSP
jgi:Domain of unknown function (DUF4340)